MNASELKYHVENARTDAKFFTRENMKFAGDTMRNYGVRSAVIQSNYDAAGNWASAEGEQREVWELYRKRPVKHGLQSSAYFDKATFAQVFAAN